MYLKGSGYENWDWIQLTHDSINLRVPGHTVKGNW